MEESVSAGCATAVCTGVQLLQMNPNTVYNTQQWKEVVEAWPGTGKPPAPGGGGEHEGGRDPSLLSGQMKLLLLLIP